MAIGNVSRVAGQSSIRFYTRHFVYTRGDFVMLRIVALLCFGVCQTTGREGVDGELETISDSELCPKK